MAKKKQKFYVVWEGVAPGIYTSWDACLVQIKGYPNARYKSFSSLKEAQEAFGDSPSDHIGTKNKKPKLISTTTEGIIYDSLSVDAACSGSPGVMEYQGVWTRDRTQVFHMGPFEWGTNNVGEFLALVHGISYLQKIGKPMLPIYSDSRTAMAWVRNKKVKTTLVRKPVNIKLFELLERAETWIRTNRWQNPLLKWDTEHWGEIPADFGRK